MHVFPVTIDHAWLYLIAVVIKNKRVKQPDNPVGI